jgi:hypothetical protein
MCCVCYVARPKPECRMYYAVRPEAEYSSCYLAVAPVEMRNGYYENAWENKVGESCSEPELPKLM